MHVHTQCITTNKELNTHYLSLLLYKENEKQLMEAVLKYEIESVLIKLWDTIENYYENSQILTLKFKFTLTSSSIMMSLYIVSEVHLLFFIDSNCYTYETFMFINLSKK